MCPAAGALPTCRAAMSTMGLTGSQAQALAGGVLHHLGPILVQQEPSFSSSWLASFGHRSACGEGHSSERVTVGTAGDWGQGRLASAWSQQVTQCLCCETGTEMLCKHLGDEVPTKAGGRWLCSDS